MRSTHPAASSQYAMVAFLVAISHRVVNLIVVTIITRGTDEILLAKMPVKPDV